MALRRLGPSSNEALAEQTLQPGDRIVITATMAEVLTLHGEKGFEILGVGPRGGGDKSQMIVEAVLAPGRGAAFKTVSGDDGKPGTPDMNVVEPQFDNGGAGATADGANASPGLPGQNGVPGALPTLRAPTQGVFTLAGYSPANGSDGGQIVFDVPPDKGPYKIRISSGGDIEKEITALVEVPDENAAPSTAPVPAAAGQ